MASSEAVSNFWEDYSIVLAYNRKKDTGKISFDMLIPADGAAANLRVNSFDIVGRGGIRKKIEVAGNGDVDWKIPLCWSSKKEKRLWC